MKRADQSPRWTDRHEAVGEKQGVDSRDEVRHNEKTDQLFVKIMMKVDGRETVTTDEERVRAAVRLNSDEVMQVRRLGSG